MVRKDQIPYVVTAYNSAPYLLKQSLFLPGGLGKIAAENSSSESSAVTPEVYRGFHLVNDSLLFVFCEIGEIYVNDRLVTFIDKSDTIRKSADALQWLQSQPFNFNHGINHLTFKSNAFIDNTELLLKEKDQIEFALNLFDYNTNTFITTLDNFAVSAEEKNISRNNMIDYEGNAYSEKQVYLQLTIKGISHEILKQTKSFNVNVYHLENSESKLPKQPISPISNYIPNQYVLYQNYPNPFNPITTITYDIPKDDFVKIEVFDIKGQKMASLIDKFKDAGRHKLAFDGSDLASGIYFYHIQAGEYQDVKKMVLLK